jgi:Tfp pilus assembly protein PilX
MTVPSTVRVSGIRQQCGSTLLVALIMLVLLTLVAVSAINSTSSSIQIVGNAQYREEATAAAQQAIENVISNTSFQTAAPVPQNIDVNNDGVADYTVTFSPAPTCLSATPVVAGAPGVPSICASSIGTVCYWTLWDVRAEVSDISTGTSIALHQGIQTIAGLNAAVTACGI